MFNRAEQSYEINRKIRLFDIIFATMGDINRICDNIQYYVYYSINIQYFNAQYMLVTVDFQRPCLGPLVCVDSELPAIS